MDSPVEDDDYQLEVPKKKRKPSKNSQLLGDKKIGFSKLHFWICFFKGDYERLAFEVRKYRILYDKSDRNYMKTNIKGDIWKEIASNLKEIDNKPVDGEKGKNFFYSSKKK